MNKPLPAPALLRSAARLIEQALIQLDMREEPCGCCGTKLFAQFEHAKVYKALSDTPFKLEAQAATLDSIKGGFRPITEGR